MNARSICFATAFVLLATPVVGADSGGLKTGEYACYGSGGRLLIGLGFKVAGNGYTDLDGKSRGTFTVKGSEFAFRGGHLDGETGHDLKNSRFRLGTMASCEPF